MAKVLLNPKCLHQFKTFTVGPADKLDFLVARYSWRFKRKQRILLLQAVHCGVQIRNGEGNMVHRSGGALAAGQWREAFLPFTGAGAPARALAVASISAGSAYRPFWRSTTMTLLVALPALGALVLVLALGKTVAGSRSWLSLGGFSLQPSELAKLALAVFLCSYAAENPERLRTFFRGFLPTFGVLGAVAVGRDVQRTPDAATVVLGTAKVFLLGVVDLGKERDKLAQQQQKLRAQIAEEAAQPFTRAEMGLPLRSGVHARGLVHDPLRYATGRLLADRAVDALLWVASFDPSQAPPAAGLPRVVLGHPGLAAVLAGQRDTVFIPVSTPGIGSAGHLFRTDGVVVVPITALYADRLPTVARVAADLAARRFGGREVEMLVFDGTTASPELTAAVAQAEALLISSPPTETGDPVLAVLADGIAARLRRGRR